MAKSRLCYNELIPLSYTVLIAYYEKKVPFEAERIELLGSENADVMVLHKNDELLEGADKILENIGESFGNDRIGALISELEGIIEELTFAICYGEGKITEKCRWPLHEAATRQSYIKYIMKTSENFRLWLERYDKEDLSECRILNSTEAVLDQVENVLSEEKRSGIWINGLKFGLTDCRLSAMIACLYQLGLENLWRNGKRPNLAMYAFQAFERPSVKKGTQWEDHEKSIAYFDQESEEVKQARYALYGAVGLAGLYILRKVFK